MRSQKVSTTLKVIFLAIDALLILAIAAAGYFCMTQWNGSDGTAVMNNQQEIEALDARIADVELQIDQMREAVATIPTEDYAQKKAQLQTQMEELSADIQLLAIQQDEIQTEIDDLNDPERMKLKIEEVRTEYGVAVRQLEDMILAGESDYRICYLTFDDGPSYQTPDFLDKLKELEAYGTFFTIGCSIQDERNLDLRDAYLRREAREGHSIANHTYTHEYYGSLYKSVDNFMTAVEQQDELVYKVTGLHTDIVRFPAGSYYTVHRTGSINALLEAGYQWMDWIGNAFDSGDNNYSSAMIAKQVIKQSRKDKITVILMHDWNVRTLGALDTIIPTLREENYLFLPLFKESVMNGNCIPKWG